MVKDKITVIVVEDNIVYCEFVCNLLAREGFRTVQAYRLVAARKLLQQASGGDIVLSDLRLPDGNGIDLLRWMRKEGLALPFIIMTDYAEVHTAVESMSSVRWTTSPSCWSRTSLSRCSATFRKNRTADNGTCPCSPVTVRLSEPS